MDKELFKYQNENWSQWLLLPGEQLIWQGAPEGGKWFTKEDIFMVPFSLLWCGFAIFWETSVLLAGIWPFALFGAFFVVVGLYMVAGRIFLRHREWGRMRYAITDQRVLWKCGARQEAMELRQIPKLGLKVHKDGKGTISFRQDMYPRYYGQNLGAFGKADMSSFENISDVERVYRILSEQIQQK